ncbi:MAG: RDD family protein [Pedosphaera sp.]|nr:RDD family protein [Pedosphaera sp.]
MTDAQQFEAFLREHQDLVFSTANQPGFIAPMAVSAAGQTAQNFTANAPGETAPGDTTPENPAAPTQPLQPTNVPEAFAHPRAGFLERMCAAFLDVVIVGILSGVASGYLNRLPGFPPFGLLIALAYFAGMWAWKGTTVGGVVLSLKVVRLDGGPVTFPVALVRGLGAALSVVVMFLGFLWIAFDRDMQGWHDRIAGTVVVRLPRGTPLVCL